MSKKKRKRRGRARVLRINTRVSIPTMGRGKLIEYAPRDEYGNYVPRPYLVELDDGERYWTARRDLEVSNDGV